MKKIAHIVPSLSTGGVEVGIERSCSTLKQHFDYRVFYVRRKGCLDCDQTSIIRLLWLSCTGRWRPDIIITSLWWAHLTGILLNIFSIKWVAFFHNSKFPHAIARFFCKIAWRKAHYRIVDSGATGRAMKQFGVRQSSTVPYVFLDNLPDNVWKERPIDFMWVGRVSSVKRLDILRDFLSLVEHTWPAARVVLILAGEAPTVLKSFFLETRLDITVENNLRNDQVREWLTKSKFYLLFSDYEGMSMTTIEAVQAGCIAVVRPVGEIPMYLDECSCVWVNDIKKENLKRVLHKCTHMICDEQQADMTRKNAYKNIVNIEKYTESMIGFLNGVR